MVKEVSELQRTPVAVHRILKHICMERKHILYNYLSLNFLSKPFTNLATTGS